MRRKNKRFIRKTAVAVAAVLTLQLTACKNSETETTTAQTERTEAETASLSQAGENRQTPERPGGAENGGPGSGTNENGAPRGPGGGMQGRPEGAGGSQSVEEPEGSGLAADYDTDDLETAWNEQESTIITCSQTEAESSGSGAQVSAGEIRITQAGTYVIRGSFEGQIVIDAGKEDVIHLVLDGANISNTDSSAVYGVQSGKIVLTLAEGTKNLISDGAEYIFSSQDEDEPDAAIFTEDSLTINGTGELAVTGNYSNGIRTKDDLKIISGAIQVAAPKDGIKGKDSVTIKDGEIRVQAGEDGIQASNDTDADKGYVIIEGGTIEIQAADDGIHAETWLTIHGGTVSVEESNEGLEGLKIDINGGNIQVTASDDAVNAAGGTAQSEMDKMQVNEEAYVRISGGSISLDASADGIDSNGHLFIKGGEIYISGPVADGEGALDYNGTALISGGTFAAASSAGMMQTFSQASEQPMLMVYYDETQAGSTSVQLVDDKGEKLLEFSPAKEFACVLISLPGLEEGDELELRTGDEIRNITVSGTITQEGERSGGRGPGGGSGGGNPRSGPGGGGFGRGREPGGGHPEQNLPDEGEKSAA